MRLSEFLRTHANQILDAWDEFAATVSHGGVPLDQKALRDHAAQILLTIANDIEQPQSAAQQQAKSRGEASRDEGLGDTAAETHADTRMVAGFDIDAMLTEYRALRASVLRLWAAAKDERATADDNDLEQLTRFNEAVDQAITESVARYTEQVQRHTALFMGMLGHDIRNPLNTIRLSAELLMRSGQLSAKAADPIVNSAKRIEGIIELVVDFSRAQTDGAMPINPRPGNLERHFRNLVNETQVRYPQAELSLHASGDLDGSWDEGRLGQLLSNLMENALAYGDERAPVEVVLEGEPDEVKISVHNFGKAIPAALRASIFEPRTRGAGHDQGRAANGLGLGLYICREIVRAHGGTLAVRSGDPEGTTFFMSLPRHPGQEPTKG